MTTTSSSLSKGITDQRKIFNGSGNVKRSLRLCDHGPYLFKDVRARAHDPELICFLWRCPLCEGCSQLIERTLHPGTHPLQNLLRVLSGIARWITGLHQYQTLSSQALKNLIAA